MVNVGKSKLCGLPMNNTNNDINSVKQVCMSNCLFVCFVCLSVCLHSHIDSGLIASTFHFFTTADSSENFSSLAWPGHISPRLVEYDYRTWRMLGYLCLFSMSKNLVQLCLIVITKLYVFLIERYQDARSIYRFECFSLN